MSAPGGATPLCLLVIDDDEVDRLLLRRLLTRGGGGHEVRHRVEEADCAEAGLARLAESSVDCVLLDLNLPDADAEEVVESLRARGTLPPLVLVSGCAPPSSRAEALQAIGPVLTKDQLDAGVLAEAIGQALARARS